MNGKAAKRIRIAARICQQDVADLKRQYRKLPYHRRKILGVHIDSHSELLRRVHLYANAHV